MAELLSLVGEGELLGPGGIVFVAVIAIVIIGAIVYAYGTMADAAMRQAENESRQGKNAAAALYVVLAVVFLALMCYVLWPRQ